MEKEYIRGLPDEPENIRESVQHLLRSKIQYADPMDLTKMLDIPPGTGPLPGVAKIMKLLYP